MGLGPSRLVSHVQNGVTVVRFTETRVIDQRNINQIGAELTDMVEKGGVRKMLINMQNVRYLSSAVLGKLVSLHKALEERKGKLKLCGVAPSVYEVFEITRLNRVFEMHNTEDEAIEAFRLRR